MLSFNAVDSESHQTLERSQFSTYFTYHPHTPGSVRRPGGVEVWSVPDVTGALSKTDRSESLPEILPKVIIIHKSYNV